MWWNRLHAVALLMLLTTPSAAQGVATQNQQAVLSQTVQDFYTWVLAHGMETRRLEPRIVPIQGSTRLALDMSTLSDYSRAFLQSGCFAPEFPSRVDSFYQRASDRLEKYSQAEFDEMAREGRGPLMDSEDIDVFFCSQEAQYTTSYATGARLGISQIGVDIAVAEVVTPDTWKTKFTFRRIGKKWLISGYCLYR